MFYIFSSLLSAAVAAFMVSYDLVWFGYGNSFPKGDTIFKLGCLWNVIFTFGLIYARLRDGFDFIATFWSSAAFGDLLELSF